jgi:hypothetical protein
VEDPPAGPDGPAYQRLVGRPPVGGGAEKIPRPRPPVGQGPLDRRQDAFVLHRFREGQAELDGGLAFAGLGRRGGLDGLLTDLDEPRPLHPGDEAVDVRDARPPYQEQGAPAMGREPQGLADEARLRPHALGLEGLPPRFGQDDRDLGPGRERRRERGLEHLAPRGVEFSAQTSGEGQEAFVAEGPVVEDLDQLLDLDAGGRRLGRDLDDEAVLPARPERRDDPRSRPGQGLLVLGHGIEKGLVERQGEDDAGEEGHFPPRSTMTFCMSSQTMRLSSRLPSLRTR